MPDDLTPLAALGWEDAHPFWRQAGAREAAVREQFGVSGTRFAQLLNAAIDDPVCVQAFPVTAGRLRRRREQGRRLRHAS